MVKQETCNGKCVFNIGGFLGRAIDLKKEYTIDLYSAVKTSCFILTIIYWFESVFINFTQIPH